MIALSPARLDLLSRIVKRPVAALDMLDKLRIVRLRFEFFDHLLSTLVCGA
jgi:hypothetical protein